MTEFGKIPWTFRGIMKCPKCKTYNGHRRVYCKNKACSEIISKDTDKPNPYIDSSKLITDLPLSIYSVRIRNNGPDYRGFVELRDVESFWVISNSVQSNSSSGICYIKNCSQTFNHNNTTDDKKLEKTVNCHHIRASINSTNVAEILTLNPAVLDVLKITLPMKQEILKLSSMAKSPLVQRISKQVMAIKTNKTKRHPLGYLHMLFVYAKKRYYCSCEVFTSKSVRKKEAMRQQIECNVNNKSKSMPYNGKCIHFYSCICAFASNPILAKEFQFFIDLVISPEDQQQIIHILKNKTTVNIDYELMMQTEKSTQDEASIERVVEFPQEQIQSSMLMMEVDANDETDKMNDIIFLKAENNTNIANVCDVFLTEASDDITKCDKPLDIQIMLASNNDLIKLPNYIIKELPIEVKTSTNDNLDGIKLNLMKNDKINESQSEIGNLIGDDLAILSDDYNSLEIMSLEQYNYLINKQGNLNEYIGDELKNDGTQSEKAKSTSFSDSEEELLFLGLNKTDKTSECIELPKLMTKKDINKLIKDIPKSKSDQKQVYELNTLMNDDMLSDLLGKAYPEEFEKHETLKLVADPSQSDEGSVQFSFLEWLASVTERINQSMHFQLSGKPKPFSYQIPHAFFECLRDRMCSDSSKKRLPNSMSEITRTHKPPIGKFTKYTWNIVSPSQVKQIFDTPQMPLEVTKYFKQNGDGTYTQIDKPKPNKNTKVCKVDAKSLNKSYNILPGTLITYLKVGIVCKDQKIPLPFCIDWIPDILPISKIGELKLKFEFGHKSNHRI